MLIKNLFAAISLALAVSFVFATPLVSANWIKLVPATGDEIKRITSVLYPKNGPNFNFSNSPAPVQPGSQSYNVQPTSTLNAPLFSMTRVGGFSPIGTNTISNSTTNSNSTSNSNTNSNFSNSQDSSGFNAGLPVNNETLYGLPDRFNSASKIQQYLRNQGSFLADYQVDVSLEGDDDLLAMTSNSLDTGNNFKQYQNTKMSFSEMVWKLSRTNMASSCSVSSRGTCVDMASNPINPAFILAMINKESGLITGNVRKTNPNSDDTKFLIERATGYLCVESSDKTKSCYDQNPNWKYYKGMFRQTYYMVRSLTLYSKRCENAGVSIYGGQLFKVGNVVTLDGEKIRLENAMSCALYIYTPHVFGQKPLFRSLSDMGALLGNYKTSPNTTVNTENFSGTLKMIRVN
jgi:hypothetical protein